MSEPNVVSIDIHVDPSIYSLAATQRALHRFTDAYFVEMFDKDRAWAIRLTSRNGTPIDANLAAHFHTLLLDESLREAVLQETRGIRDTLIAVAFRSSRPSAASKEPGS